MLAEFLARLGDAFDAFPASTAAASGHAQISAHTMMPETLRIYPTLPRPVSIVIHTTLVDSDPLPSHRVVHDVSDPGIVQDYASPELPELPEHYLDTGLGGFAEDHIFA